jgi:threonine dehydrogenase-like Zn-dependent dehydrogenase
MHGYGDMRLDEVPDPVVKPGWVKVRIRVAQPSITEALLFRGAKTYLHGKVAELLARGPAQLFGHEFSAVVAETGEGVQSLAPGDRVAAVRELTDGRVNVKPLVARVLEGIERVPEAFDLTARKSELGLVNPAQVVISA